jgi:hypothetical protein
MLQSGSKQERERDTVAWPLPSESSSIYHSLITLKFYSVKKGKDIPVTGRVGP